MARIFGAYFRKDPGAGVFAALDQNWQRAYVQLSQIPSVAELKVFPIFGGARIAFAIVRHERESPCITVCPSQSHALIYTGSLRRKDCLLSIEELLELFRQKGPAHMLDGLDGPAVLWAIDLDKGNLFAIRDRVGQNLLYFASSSKAIAFSNSPAGTILAGFMKPRSNDAVLAKYASSSYRSVFGREETFFAGIELLAPATYLEISPELKVTEKGYWDFNADTPESCQSLESLVKEYRTTLTTELSAHLNILTTCRQGETAVSLSGGLDSASLCALMHEIQQKQSQAISVVYDEECNFSEHDLIPAIVKDHVDKWQQVRPNAAVILDRLEDLYDVYEQPLPTVTQIVQRLVYETAAQEGISQLVFGSGGDFIQAGNYPNYLYFFADLKATGQSDLFKREVAAWIRCHSTEQFPKSMATVEKFFADAIDWSVPGRLRPLQVQLSPENSVLGQRLNQLGRFTTDMPGPYGKSYARSFLAEDFWYEGNAPCTPSNDLNSWITGVKAVEPYYALALIDLAWKTPFSIKIKDGLNKQLTRQAFRDILPQEVLDQRIKRGLNAPLDLWIRGMLREFVLDLINSQEFRERGFFDIQKLQQILEAHLSGKENHMMLIWQAVNLELWFQKWHTNQSAGRLRCVEFWG